MNRWVLSVIAISCLHCGGSGTPGADHDAGSLPGDAGRPPIDAASDDPSLGEVIIPPPVGQIHCDDDLFVDNPELSWVDVNVTPEQGMDGIRTAIAESDRIQPTRVRVAAGTYTGMCLYVEDHLRSAEAPLWLLAEGDVQIDCSDGNGQAFGFVHSSYIAIDGFTFGPETGYYGDTGIHISGNPIHTEDPAYYGVWGPSRYIVIRNNTMRNLNRGPDGDGNPDHYESASADGAKSNQVEWVWYINNTISRTSRHGIDNVGVHHAAICHNTLFDLVGEGQGIESKGGSYDILIEGNYFNRVFHRALMLGGEGTNNNFMWPTNFPTEAYGVVARNNVVVNAADGGITFYGCWSCTAINNSIWFTLDYDVVDHHDFMRMYPSILEGGTFDDAWGVARRAEEVLTNRDNRVINNFFGDAEGLNTCPLDASGDGSGTMNLSFSHNAFYNGGNALMKCGEGTTGLGGYPSAGPTLDESGVTAEGSFPATAPDLTPTSGSRLVGAGVADPLVPTTDFAGRARSNPPAIGALEPD